jgi:hypothetical protein
LQHAGILADDLVARVPGDLAERGIDVDDAPIAIGDDDAFVRRAEHARRKPQPRLRILACLLHPIEALGETRDLARAARRGHHVEVAARRGLRHRFQGCKRLADAPAEEPRQDRSGEHERGDGEPGERQRQVAVRVEHVARHRDDERPVGEARAAERDERGHALQRTARERAFGASRHLRRQVRRRLPADGFNGMLRARDDRRLRILHGADPALGQMLLEEQAVQPLGGNAHVERVGHFPVAEHGHLHRHERPLRDAAGVEVRNDRPPGFERAAQKVRMPRLRQRGAVWAQRVDDLLPGFVDEHDRLGEGFGREHHPGLLVERLEIARLQGVGSREDLQLPANGGEVALEACRQRARRLQRALLELLSLGAIDFVKEKGRRDDAGHQRRGEQPSDAVADRDTRSRKRRSRLRRRGGQWAEVCRHVLPFSRIPSWPTGPTHIFGERPPGAVDRRQTAGGPMARRCRTCQTRRVAAGRESDPPGAQFARQRSCSP